SVPAETKSLRRSLYVLQKRDSPPPIQALFDGPAAALESCPQRLVSTVPLQALFLLNNEFSQERARAFARRVHDRAGDDRERQAEAAFVLALARLPDDAERSASRRFFERHQGAA